MPYISDRRLYLTADKTTMVEHSDARAAWLLMGKGGILPDELAQCYGLTDFRIWHLSSARGIRATGVCCALRRQQMAVSPVPESRRNRTRAFVSPKSQIDPARVIVWGAVLGMMCVNLLALGYGVVLLSRLLF